jgi:hypothetical protein
MVKGMGRKHKNLAYTSRRKENENRLPKKNQDGNFQNLIDSHRANTQPL